MISDWSIFIDADATLIEQWYLGVSELLMDRAVIDRITNTINMRLGVVRTRLRWRKMWQKTNLNLKEYILPTETRADFILHKTVGHHIDVQIKKY